MPETSAFSAVRSDLQVVRLQLTLTVLVDRRFPINVCSRSMNCRRLLMRMNKVVRLITYTKVRINVGVALM
jgi:hypothetical protein